MPDRDAVLSLVRQGRSYEEIGSALHVAPGLAYLIATGLPADGSDVVEYDGDRREGVLAGSSQHLANPKAVAFQRDSETVAWIRSRAAHDDAMRRAASARELSPPPIAAVDETDDITSVLGWEHGQAEYLLKELEAIPDSAKGDAEDAATRARVVELMRTTIRQHEDLEEQHFWPRVRNWFSDGPQIADTAREQEQHGAAVLDAFVNASAEHKEFDELVKQLAKALRSHVAFEDTVLLRTRDTVSEEARVDAGRAYKQAKGMPLAHASSSGKEAS